PNRSSRRSSGSTLGPGPEGGGTPVFLEQAGIRASSMLPGITNAARDGRRRHDPVKDPGTGVSLRGPSGHLASRLVPHPLQRLEGEIGEVPPRGEAVAEDLELGVRLLVAAAEVGERRILAPHVIPSRAMRQVFSEDSLDLKPDVGLPEVLRSS